MSNKILWFLAVAFAMVAGGGAGASGVGGGGGGDRPINARALELAAARGCEMGPVFYRMEADEGANRPVLKRVQYVCVDGVYRRNGYVPKYHPRCIEGEDRMITEQQDYGNHQRPVKVRYTCRGGMLRRNP